MTLYIYIYIYKYIYIYIYICAPIARCLCQTSQPLNHPQPTDIPNGPLARSDPIRPNYYTRSIRGIGLANMTLTTERSESQKNNGAGLLTSYEAQHAYTYNGSELSERS